MGTTVSGRKLAFVRTLSKESSSSSITPGPGKIFLFEWMRRISSFLYLGCFSSCLLGGLAGLLAAAALHGDASEPDEYSVDGDSNFMESTLNFTSIFTGYCWSFFYLSLLVMVVIGVFAVGLLISTIESPDRSRERIVPS